MIVNIAANFFKVLKPVSRLTISQWANKYRYLSPEDSASVGKYSTALAPYQVGPMDAFNEEGVEGVVMLCSAQVGKTLILTNVIGYFTHIDPAPVLAVLPTEGVAKDFSKTRITPMIRDTPVLAEIFGKRKSRSSGNTLLAKEYPGGRMVFVGSNAPSGLSSKPIRVVLGDEVRLFEQNKDGDPIEQALKRTTTFFNSIFGLFSTPGIEGACRITNWFNKSDKRKYKVPCPYCGHEQIFKWSNVKWKKTKSGDIIESSVKYECENSKCRKYIPHSQKAKMLAKGRWEATEEFKGIAGFWINEIYSPWVTWYKMALKFQEAKKNRETLRDFVNLSLGETWIEEGIKIDFESLYDWREDYGKGVDIPQGGLILVQSADVQDDRIEGEAVAFGVGQESWGVDHWVVHGNPSLKTTWDSVEQNLKKIYTHEDGTKMQASCVTIDSGGHYTTDVYAFTKKFEILRWFSTKGSSVLGKPIVPATPSKVGRLKNKLWMVGTDAAKQLIYNRLMMDNREGPGKMHFPMHYTEEYFRQLTAEKALYKKDASGFLYRKWVKIRPRNEVLDIRVGSLVALGILNPNFTLLSERGPIKAAIQSGRKPRRKRSPGITL